MKKFLAIVLAIVVSLMAVDVLDARGGGGRGGGGRGGMRSGGMRGGGMRAGGMRTGGMRTGGMRARGMGRSGMGRGMRTGGMSRGGRSGIARSGVARGMGRGGIGRAGRSGIGRSRAARGMARGGAGRRVAGRGAYAHRGNRGWGRHGWNRGWWGGWGWGWGFSPWAWGWGAGLLGLGLLGSGLWYDYAIPREAVTVVYNDYYPYWGYDLVDEEIEPNMDPMTFDQLAQQKKWDEVQERLKKLRDDYGKHMTSLHSQYEAIADKNSAEAQSIKEQIDSLDDRISKVQLHLSGLQKSMPSDVKEAAQNGMNVPQTEAATGMY